MKAYRVRVTLKSKQTALMLKYLVAFIEREGSDPNCVLLFLWFKITNTKNIHIHIHEQQMENSHSEKS